MPWARLSSRAGAEPMLRRGDRSGQCVRREPEACRRRSPRAVGPSEGRPSRRAAKCRLSDRTGPSTSPARCRSTTQLGIAAAVANGCSAAKAAPWQYDPSPALRRKHWSEKTDSSISLTYQQMQQTERTVIRQLGEIPTNNRNRTVTNAQQTKEVAMKSSNFKFKFVASWAVALSVFVGAGGAQYICARSNASSV